MKYLERILRREMARSDYIIKDYLDAMKSNWGDWIGGYNNGALA